VNASQPTTLDQVITVAGTILDSPHVQATDNIFTYGGDSLTVVTFCAELKAVLGVAVPLDVVWDADDFSAVAARIAHLVHPGAPQQAGPNGEPR
jgi:acyl carrier protein